MISNLEAFLAIAREAHEEMTRLMEEGRSPKQDGSGGYVVSLDPEQRAFKQALITITFAGIYFEALTFFVARQISKSKAERVDKAGYRDKLTTLGIRDESLLDAAESFRLDRNDLVHEKATSFSELNWPKTRFAQPCADRAMEFVAAVQQALLDIQRGQH